MVFSFCRLDLPQASYDIIKTLQDFYEIRFCANFYNAFILKISAWAIMPGFRKSGHIYYVLFFLARKNGLMYCQSIINNQSINQSINA